MKNIDYVSFSEYMAKLASEHTQIHHSPSELHFCRGELQDFWSKSRSDIYFPCVILEGRELEYSSNSSQIFKTISSAFIIQDTYELNGDYEEIEKVLSSCEKIGEDFLTRMILDAHSQQAPFIRCEINDIDAVFIQNTAYKYVGCRFSFSIKHILQHNNSNIWIK